MDLDGKADEMDLDDDLSDEDRTEEQLDPASTEYDAPAKRVELAEMLAFQDSGPEDDSRTRAL